MQAVATYVSAHHIKMMLEIGVVSPLSGIERPKQFERRETVKPTIIAA